MHGREESLMEILVLGDSLAFGRPKYGISRDLTWPYLLRKELRCHLQIRAKGGSTIVDVAKEAQSLNRYWFGNLKTRKFDVTFIQVGIVDCCPRLFPKCFGDYPLRVPVVKSLSRSSFAHRLFARPWVSEDNFSERLLVLCEILWKISEKIYFIEIARPANHLIENVGDFSENVERYNKIINQFSDSNGFIEWQTDYSGNLHILPDGHHLTLLGHQEVSKACLNKYRATF